MDELSVVFDNQIVDGDSFQTLYPFFFKMYKMIFYVLKIMVPTCQQGH